MVSRRRLLRGGVAGAATVLLPGVARAHHRPSHTGGPPGQRGGEPSGQSRPLVAAVEVDVPNDITWSLGFPPDGTIWDVPLATTEVNGSTGTYSGVQPGDTLRLESGTRGPLIVRSMVGTAQAPITITDDGGVVNIVGTGGDPGTSANPNPANLGVGSTAGVYFRDACRHVRLVGSSQQVGATVAEGSQSATIRISRCRRGVYLWQPEESEFLEVGYVEVFDTNGNPGVHSGDGTRATFPRQRGIWVHDCYLHNIVDSEGVYLGSSFWQNGDETEVDGIVVERMLVVDAAYDGIQVGSAAFHDEVPGGYTKNRVSGNVIVRAGQAALAQANGHTKGIIVNRGSRLDVIGNRIVEPGGQGIYDQGLGAGSGEFLVHANNVIVRSGQTHSGGQGIHVAAGEGSAGDLHLVANTVVGNAGHAGLSFSRGYGVNRIDGNIVLGNNGISGNANTTEQANRTTGTVGDAGFVDSGNDDYHLTAGSPCVGAGVDLSSLGVTTDIDGVARPQGGTWDQGAYERVGG